MTFAEGDRIIFYPGGNKPGRKGHYIGKVEGWPDIVHVILDTDPYDVCVLSEYVRGTSKSTHKENTQMATATKTKPKAKDLRRDAKALGVEGWEDMDLDELIEAVDEAKEAEASAAKKSKKSTSKKATTKRPVDEDEDDEDDDEDDDDEDEAPAKSKKSSKGKKATAKSSTKKATTKKSSRDDDDLPENGNPFTEGTNLYYMTEELIKGGKRSAMVKRLGKKISLKPRTRSFTEEEELAEIDRRLVIVSQVLRNQHGFKMEREGRGADTQIRLYK